MARLKKVETLDDVCDKCKGKHSNRIGIYHPPEVCSGYLKYYCSARYWFEKDNKKGFAYSDPIMKRYIDNETPFCSYPHK